MGTKGTKGRTARKRVEIRAGGQMIAGSHTYVSSYEAYQAAAIEAAGALGEIQSGASWRMLLLGGAAAGALSFGISREGHAAPDACVLSGGNTYTCTGNQSAGISYNGVAGITTLNANTLNQNIAPAANTAGIYFNAVGAATLTSNTGVFTITTTTGGAGVEVTTPGASAVNVSHTGDINADGKGVRAYSAGGGVTVNTTGDITSTIRQGIEARDSAAGAVMVTHTGGNITASLYGVYARSGGGGVTVNTTGDITSTGSQGIKARDTGAGAVMLTHTGNTTASDRGVFAQSVGGGVTVSTTGNITSTANRGIDAEDTAAGAVMVTHSGNITANLQGVNVRSAGGGITVNTTGDITATTLAGIDARDSAAGAVMVTHTGGNIQARTQGVFAYSVGGGVTVSTTGDITSTTRQGIEARDSAAGAVMVTHTGGNITASLYGVYARSAGGGVTVNTTGNVTSTGNRGIFAFDTVAGAVNVTHTGGNIQAQTQGVYAHSVTGPVAVTVTGDITAQTYGVYALSNGGGITVNTAGNVTAATGYGVQARDIGAGAVMMTHTGGNIQALDSGVYGRSTGGGVTINTTGNVTSTNEKGIYARDSSGGAVSVSHTGDVTANREGVHALTTSGTITVSTNGDITSAIRAGVYARASATATINVTHSGGTITGTAGQGIFVRQDGVGTSTVNVTGGTVTGDSAGVRFQTNVGSTNILNNSGLITSPDDAVEGGNGNDTVNNSGIITGDVDLGPGTNAFNNLAGGLFNSRNAVTLRAGNVLTNAGNLSPGGLGTIQTTGITGNLTQTAGGTTTIDVNMAAMTNDLVTVTGTANLAGSVTLNLLTVNNAAQTITVQTTTGANTDNGLTLNAPAAVQGTLVVNANNVQVTFNVNFLGAGVLSGTKLTPNQQATATALNGVLASGAPGAQGLLTALANLPTGAFGDALDQLSPEALGNFSFGTLLASLGFTDNAMSCKAAAGMYAFINEAECVWIRPGARRFIQDRTDDNLGFTESAFGLSGGVQTALDRDKTWFAGVTAGYEHVDFESDAGRTIVTGSRLQGGAVLKHLRGPLLLAAGVTGGYGTFESARTIRFAGFNGVAEGDFNTPFVTGRLRAAYLFEGPSGQQADWYVKPAVDLDFTWLKRSGFTESGATAANLAIANESQFTVSVSPSIEIGGEFEIGTSKARPFLKVGAQIFSNTENSTTARFAAAPGSPNFTVTSKTDRVFGTVSTGIDVVHAKSLSLKLQYDGKFGANARQHAIGAKFSWRF